MERQFGAPEIVKSESNSILEIFKEITPRPMMYDVRYVVRNCNGEEIFSTERGECGLRYTFYNHVDGNEYLILGGGIEGYHIVNLTNGKHKSFPHKDSRGTEEYWYAIYPLEEKSQILLHCTMWACPADLITIDFSNPMEGFGEKTYHTPEVVEPEDEKEEDYMIVPEEHQSILGSRIAA